MIVLNIKGKHNFKHFYYIHIVETPTQKGEHCTEEMYRVVTITKRGNYRVQSYI